MKKLVFATNNSHKLRELSQIMPPDIELLSLEDIGCADEIPETGPTLEINAAQKSFYIWNKYGLNCFADDTGLEIEALGNEPGVFSARYAGEARDANANIIKVLENLNNNSNRKARFRCVISLVIDGYEIQFEGIVNGAISTEKFGNSGFGYDPIFIPDGYDRSFAELSPEIKNAISHRGLAVMKLVDYLRNREK
jgi:XTP/dITP diphosphohydrolase